MKLATRKVIESAIVQAVGSDAHVIPGVLFPTLPAELAEQVKRERAEFAAKWAAKLEATEKPNAADIARRVAYIRVRREHGAQ